MPAKIEVTRFGPSPHLAGSTLARIAASALGKVVVVLGAVQPVMSEENGRLVQCDSIISLEKRHIMERWSKQGGCDRPTRARFTDGLLDFVPDGGAASGAPATRLCAVMPAERLTRRKCSVASMWR